MTIRKKLVTIDIEELRKTKNLSSMSCFYVCRLIRLDIKLFG